MGGKYPRIRDFVEGLVQELAGAVAGAGFSTHQMRLRSDIDRLDGRDVLERMAGDDADRRP